MARILIADDEKMIANLIADSLEDEGYEVEVVYNGQAVVSLIDKNPYFDLIILDVMMPKLDGYATCNQIRQKVQCPILFVTAKTRTLDTLLGLELGGDDYIKKPFIIAELIAKVKAHLRREQRKKEPIEKQKLYFGDIAVYLESMEVYVNKKPILLTTREFSLLCYLIKNANRVLTREQIFDAVWGVDYSDIGAVTVTIKNIRDKLDPNNKMIKTVWGMGYKMVEPIGE